MISYLVAATPRVGGTWLCDLLTDAGLGEPGEHVNWLVEDGEGRELESPALVNLRSLWQLRAPGGVYGVKVHLTEQVARLALDDLLPPGRRSFVYLTRDDRAAQARSLAVARRYGCWFSHRPAHAGATTADIGAARADLDAMNTRWRRWFAAQAVVPLQITYEDLVTDPNTTVAAIEAHVRGNR